MRERQKSRHVRHVEARARRNAFRDGFAGFALYVHFYLSGRLSAVFHALYIAVAAFKIARCTTGRVQIYFPLSHTSFYRLLRVGCTVVLWSLHSPRDHANIAVSLGQLNYFSFLSSLKTRRHW